MINLTNLLSQATDPIGTIVPPLCELNDVDCGLMAFISNLIKLILSVGGLYTFFNIMMAGIGFMGAGGDAKKIEQAWAKIWQSIIGLVIMVGSFIIMAVLGILIFNDPSIFLKLTIFGPGAINQK